MPTKLYKIGLNTSVLDKASNDHRVNLATDWLPSKISADELAEHIASGFAFTAHFKDGYRRTANFECADFIAADFDGTMRLDDALELSFVQNYASLIYTTPSHREEEHRFRIVFLLEETITGPRQWADALKGLAHRLGSDPSIKDAARIFFGSRDCQMVRVEKTLPSVEVDRLIALAADERARRKHQGSTVSAITSHLKLSAHEFVELAEGGKAELSSLAPNISVYCPYHGDEHPIAHVVRSKRGSNGIHCMACDATFWSDQGDPYDFEAFDRLVEERLERDQRISEGGDGSNPFAAFFPPEPSVTLSQTKYLAPIPYQPGITVIKSPKGSGKTAALSAMVEQIRGGRFRSDIAKQDQAASVLLIGHRQSLIKEAANRLGIDCYLDYESIGGHRNQRFGYAICLDSLPKVTTAGGRTKREAKWQKPPQYDVVILDESEQVISHLLSETLRERNGMAAVFASLEFIIRRAKAVYALDADLGLITLHALKALRPDDWDKRLHIVHNKPIEVTDRRPMAIYKSRKDLQSRMFSRIREGKRCFIASNSKNMVEIIEEMIRSEFGSAAKIMAITSENSRGKVETHFVENIQTEYLKKQVLICSPSLGTGIDISFPDGRCEVDEVIGFFSPHVNKHTDIDQQLARVRNPGAVSIWFDGGTANYETNLDVVKDQLAAANFVPGALTGMLDDVGRPAYDPDNPLLNIAAHVMVAQRSSQNRIQTLFAELRHANGWDIEVVEKLPTSNKNPTWREAKRNLKEKFIAGVLGAESVDDSTALELEMARDRGIKLSPPEKYALLRYQLEQAYQQPITRQLIEMDNNGKLRDQIDIYRQIFGKPEYVEHLIVGLAEDIVAKRQLAKNPPWVLCAAAMIASGIIRNGALFEDLVLRGDRLDIFKDMLKRNRVLFEEVLQMPLRQDWETNPVRQLNVILAKAGIKLLPGKRRQRGGASSVEYTLDNTISRWAI